jgi:hypothetical protein
MSADKNRCLSEKDLDRWTHQPAPAEQVAKIQDHVRGCESCQERVQGEQLFSEALREALCPSDAELALWAEGELPLNRARKVQDHISSCDECSDVAELTTEANEWLAAQASSIQNQSRSRDRSNTKRRRSATKRVSPIAGPQPASAPAWLVWAAPAAAAALLMALFAASPSRERHDRSASLDPPKNSSANPIQYPDAGSPSGTGSSSTDNPINVLPPSGTDPESPIDANPKTDPGTSPETGTEPTNPLRPDPETPESPDSSDPQDPSKIDPAQPQPKTGTEVRKNPASARAGLQVAMATGKLSSRQGSGSWTRLNGAAELSAEHEIAARGGHGAMTFASVDLSLRDGAALRLERDDESEACLELSSGEALFSVRPAGRRFVARVGEQRITALGTRFLIRQRKGSAGSVEVAVEVAVEEGQVELSNPQGKILVSAGESALAEKDRAPQRLPSIAVDRGWIDELIETRLQTQGLSYPRAVLALAALEALQPELSRGTDSQAAALFALRGLLSDPSLALLAPTTLAPRLERLASELGAAELSAEAQSKLVLAQCLEAWSLVGARKGNMKTLTRRAPEAAASLLAQSQKLLAAQRADWRSIAALRMAERFGLEIASAEAWTKLSEQLAASEAPNLQDGLALLLLPRKSLRSPSKALSARLRAAESLAETWLEDASLPPLEAQALCSVLARSSAANRFEALLSRLVGARAPSASDQLLVLSRAFPLLMDGALPRLEESTGPKVLRDGKDYIVAFEFKPTSFQKHVFLCGDWDQWVETSSPMSRDRDGSFRLKKRFAPGMHQYKFRQGDADANWFTDPLHPITIDNGHGGLNSLLVLP